MVVVFISIAVTASAVVVVSRVVDTSAATLEVSVSVCVYKWVRFLCYVYLCPL